LPCSDKASHLERSQIQPCRVISALQLCSSFLDKGKLAGSLTWLPCEVFTGLGRASRWIGPCETGRLAVLWRLSVGGVLCSASGLSVDISFSWPAMRMWKSAQQDQSYSWHAGADDADVELDGGPHRDGQIVHCGVLAVKGHKGLKAKNADDSDTGMWQSMISYDFQC
jgi:hypothetical protein